MTSRLSDPNGGRQRIRDRARVRVGDVENHRIAVGAVFRLDFPQDLDANGFGEPPPEWDELLGHVSVELGFAARRIAPSKKARRLIMFGDFR